MLGVANYKVALQGKDAQFTAHPSTWLNQQRWLDEVGAPPAREDDQRPATEADKKVGEQVRLTIEAYALRDKLLEHTREELGPKIEAVAGKLKSTSPEVWSCMCVGAKGLGNRAWMLAEAAVMGGPPLPSSLKMTPEGWLEVRERVETRARHVKGMQQKQWSKAVDSATVEARTQERNHDGEAEARVSEAPDGREAEGMARGEADEDRRLGREHHHVGESRGDLEPVEGQDWPGPA
jgi:hypothetical protein